MIKLIITLLVIILSVIYTNMSTKKLLQVEFEVFGRVQGVFFRKCTQEQSEKLGLKGWCMNTRDGTVRGIIEGDLTNINEMKYWLEKKGSPKSKIDKAVFKNENEIPSLTFSNFKIR